MTWNYSGNPTTSTEDELRYLLGDTDAADPLFSDEEIQYELASQSNTMKAAIHCCIVLSNRFARKAKTKDIGPLKVQYADLSEQYAKRAESLRKELAYHVTPPTPSEMGLREDAYFDLGPPRYFG